ncbi:hypothetical protein C8R47DRAFT_1199892 [Mycena vitilis]|nr:hypothetical protein C8R47DRAFT_1076900 [Mycena vitilis]KAJ6472749.1 hypothetical protein C8R47DRAFT_1199892 [Mycena vitilis]
MHRVPRRVMGWFALSGGAARRQHLQHHVMDSRECLLHPAQLFFRQFGRRQACAASKLNVSGPLDVCAVRFGEAPRSGAECFDRIYCVPAACVPISAHGAFKFKRPDCGVAGVQCVVEEPRSGAECLDTAYQLPAKVLAAGGAGTLRFEAHEPNIQLTVVCGAECFDATYRAPANYLSALAPGAHKLNEPGRRREAAPIASTRRIASPQTAFRCWHAAPSISMSRLTISRVSSASWRRHEAALNASTRCIEPPSGLSNPGTSLLHAQGAVSEPSRIQGAALRRPNLESISELPPSGLKLEAQIFTLTSSTYQRTLFAVRISPWSALGYLT